MRISHLIVLSLAATLVWGCNSERVDRGEAGDAGISFSTRLSTRGTVVADAAGLATAGGFDVWAFGHTGAWSASAAAGKTAIMDALPVTSTDGGTTWSYGEPQEWPSGNVSFFAYAPSESATVTTKEADGTPKISYTVAGDVADQLDLFIASPVKDQNSMMYPSEESKVNIVFKHALSRISFSGLLTDADDSRTITVKEITLNNLYSAGTTPLTDPAVWTLSGSATTDYTVSVESGTLLGTTFTDEGVSLTGDDDYLFLMPQTVVRTLDQPTMDVTLMVNGVETTYSAQVFSPAVWVPGRSYNYQLAVSPNDLRIIVIDTELTLDNFTPSIALNTIYLTTDATEDTKNLDFAMGALNTLNGDGTYDGYSYFGLYAVNAVSHDITIDMSTLPGGGATSNYSSGDILILDLRKQVTSWGTNPATSDPWTVSLINFDTYWTLQPSKQLGGGVSDVDASTGATNLTPSDVITSRGVFILQRK
jgi:hypothetical protein